MRTNRSSGFQAIRLTAAIGLLVAGGLFSERTSAQWIVNDPLVNGTSIYDMGQSAAEFAKQLQRWNEQMRQYREALAVTSRMFESPSLPMKLDLKSRSEDFGAAENCPSPDGSAIPSPTSILESTTPRLNGNILEDQQRVCLNIVHLQNKKYNQLVEMVAMAEKRKAAINKVLQDAKSDNTDGAQKAAMIKAQELMGQTLAEMQYSQARVQAFDGMIASLTNDQKVLAERALRGSQNPMQGLVGALIQGAVLDTSLDLLRTKRERNRSQNRPR